ncbi:pyruvate, phosphate dikinase [Candidatus Poribacteria bacterium]|nr:MAG: pyruvate, phosphate dikinase [Candidatus Poribacteria bacterium]
MGAPKYVYFFGKGKAEGNAKMRDLLGGKGAGLAEMTNIGIPVPPGFTITTEVCRLYYRNNKQFPEGLEEQVEENLRKLEEAMGAKFGDPENPLLVSVRSGAPISMPGMMDTILNLGLNDETVQGLIRRTNNPRFAYDAYRRFVQMFGNVVLGVPHSKFEELIEAKKRERGVQLDIELDADDWRDLVAKFKKLIKEETGQDFPEDPKQQLWMAIRAVFESWNNERAIIYRKIHDIPDDLGTAVNVQAMVFGNMGETSGTGVAFTRNPATGEKKVYGEFLINAQGEDVVAGIRTPQPIDELAEIMPDVYKQLMEVCEKLERHYKDMQDIEFTVQEGKLYLLQTRTGKRTGLAAVKIAVDMVREGLIDEEEALLRVDPMALDQLLHPMIDPNAQVNVITKGLPASPGAAVGRVVFSAKDAEEWAARGEKVILVRPETSPEDIGGMHAAQGILTSRGGMTSHAAVVARGMGKPCVVGAGEILVDEGSKEFRVGDIVVKEGDYITIDGSTGNVILGEAPLVEPRISGDFEILMKWADKYRKLGVRTNADTPRDAKVARDFGAEGIGLCRTEHMFFEGDRIKAMREMIMARDPEGRRQALAKLLPYQREDFIKIFEVMDGLPVIIRTLDPPLHEFLPRREELIREIDQLKFEIAQSKSMEEMDEKLARLRELEELLETVERLHEFNPMLGFRGCRLGLVYPEVTEMQARAIFEAAAEVTKRGIKAIPEIMIPLVGNVKELRMQREIVDRVAEEVMRETGVEIEYMVGTMIEVPRAALTADEIAEVAQFFSFGTNDLTQMTLGMSRDDVAKFLDFYIDNGIYEKDPFQTLDQTGVGQLIEIAVKKGRSTNPKLEVGICGEHGGDPASIEFCHRVGMDYVSCSPYRVPIARLAAAQAAIKEKREKEGKE